MCGRYTAPYTGHDLEVEFELARNIGHFEPTWNASPGQWLPVITKHSPKQGIMMKWGFIPVWEKDFTKPKIRPPINARDDKLSGGFFRQDFMNNRCLIPAGGYYEWREIKLEKKDKPLKQPYYFRMKNEKLMRLGGFYSVHKDAEGKEFYFFCIITTPPNSLQKPIHDRMPLIIDKKNEDTWFDTDKPMDMVKPFDSDLMEVYRVPTLVSSFKNDGPQLIERIPML